MSPEIIESLFIAYANFDGSFDKRDGCTSITISTIDKDNADILRTMSLFCNRRCTLIEKERTTSFGTNYFYTINSSDNNTSRVNEDKYYKEDYKGFVWCLNNINTTLFIKRNGKVSIQGNCKGQAADCNFFVNKVEDNTKILEAIKALNHDFDQCILEFKNPDGKPAWIHIIYSLFGNRKQVLESFKVGKATRYKPSHL
jgi:hypothetical protein